MLQRLIDNAQLPEAGSDLPGRIVLALGVASLSLSLIALFI